MQHIDLNCDMGELPEAAADGRREARLRPITSANVAGGGHAGDAQTMRATVGQAVRARVAIGAHPGCPDRENFGRLDLDMPLEALAASVCQQVRGLAEIAAACGARLAHVKPHGALYNQVVKNRDLAAAIAAGVAKALGLDLLKSSIDCHPEPAVAGEGSAFRPSTSAGWNNAVVLVGLAGSPLPDPFRHASLPVAPQPSPHRPHEPPAPLPPPQCAHSP